MPRLKTSVGLASLVESDSGPDFDSFDVAESSIANITSQSTATKRPRGRPPAVHKVTKPAPKPARRASAGRPAARTALAEKGNVHDLLQSKTTSAIEEAESRKPKRGRPKVKKISEQQEIDDEDIDVLASEPSNRGVVTQTGDEIPETQDGDAMEVDGAEEDRGIIEPWAVPDRHAIKGVEDGDVASLKQSLVALTNKYKDLEARHKELYELGVKQAERNVERVKKHAEEGKTATQSLIAELKTELSAQRANAKQKEALQQQLELSEAESRTQSTKLTEARSELKTLANKLAAVRKNEANAATSIVPASASKGSAAAARGAAQAVAVQTAQLKEDLYSDLTGLIVRGVKHDETEHVFDCIQTGRNGTLHFKLALDADDMGDSYEDAQFTYSPQLDASRDAELTQILPSYLIEEITFKRSYASAFYARVSKSLTEALPQSQSP